MFSRELLDHFEHPRNAGELENAAAEVEVTNPACGDVLRLSARVEAGRIAAVRFKAKGCVPAMACGSAVTTLLEGVEVHALAAISPDRIADAVGGLPEHSHHAAQLARDAVEALRGKLGGH